MRGSIPNVFIFLVLLHLLLLLHDQTLSRRLFWNPNRENLPSLVRSKIENYAEK